MLPLDVSALVREEASEECLGGSGRVALRLHGKMLVELEVPVLAACCFATSWLTISLAATSGRGEFERLVIRRDSGISLDRRDLLSSCGSVRPAIQDRVITKGHSVSALRFAWDMDKII